MARIIPGIIMILGGANSNLLSQADTLKRVDPIEVDRPDQTETASLVPKGYFQMETGFSIEDTEPGFLYTYPSILWKIGVNENFELRIITEYINIQRMPNPDIGGVLPIEVGFKSKILDQHGLVPKTAFLGHLSLPGVASEHFATTYFATNMKFAFQHTISDRFSVGYNLGMEWDGEDPRPTFIYTLATGVSVLRRLGIFLEVYGDVPQQREDDFRHRLDGGFTYLIGRDVLLDISGGMGLSDNAPERFIGFGVSYRFKM
jgi:hypothetical protein